MCWVAQERGEIFNVLNYIGNYNVNNYGHLVCLFVMFLHVPVVPDKGACLKPVEHDVKLLSSMTTIMYALAFNQAVVAVNLYTYSFGKNPS